MSAAQPVDTRSAAPAASGVESEKASPAARRVLDEITRVGLPFTLRLLPDAVRTPEEVAEFLGCDIHPIVIATVLRGKTTKKPFLLLQSAATKLNDKMLGMIVGENLQRADDDFIQRLTGYPNGAVPPLAHLNRVPVMLDGSLMRFARVWCRAGDAAAIVSVPTLVLARTVSARIVRLDY